MKKILLVITMFALLAFSAATAQAFFIDFENGLGKNNQPIIDIPGVSFLITGGYNWIYGDSSTYAWNTKSIDLGYGAGSYQHYGNVFAFLGTDNNAGSGIIDFTNNDGTRFKTGYTSYSTFHLEGYDSTRTLIASSSGPGNLDQADMGWLEIFSPSGQFFDYVIVHDSGNYFIVDNMSGDSSGVNPSVPEPSTIILLAAGLAGAAITARKFRK
ncbi:MAG: PEP-CTERM sorting domain-containing protein [Nitrospirae bacterium]|nr:PEP-CTERM sorting domain-containing protein [Nitrospirota bacterium]